MANTSFNNLFSKHDILTFPISTFDFKFQDTDNKFGLMFYRTYENKETIEIINTYTLEEQIITIPSNSIVIFDVLYKIFGIQDTCYINNFLPFIYRNTFSRYEYYKYINKILKLIECDNFEKEVIAHTSINSGCYGSVYKGKILKTNSPLALKYSKLNSEMLNNIIDKKIGWNEFRIFKDIINPLIKKGISQNLPLMYNYKICNSNEKLDPKKKEEITEKSLILMTELANCNLKEFLLDTPDDKILDNCLFQIMAGLYALQKHGAVLNFDIKAENIIVYKIQRGGYWTYDILNTTFYIPNYGYLFVITDFGLSRSMSINHIMVKNSSCNTFRIGKRYGLVKDGKFWPVENKKQLNDDETITKTELLTWDDGDTSYGGEYRCLLKDEKIFSSMKLSYEQKMFIKLNNVKNIFDENDLFPPFEFFGDTQDVIRMFLGKKRTTQKGYHSKYSFSKKFLKKLELFVYEDENTIPKDASVVLAGEFIIKYFKKMYSYVPRASRELQSFKI